MLPYHKIVWSLKNSRIKQKCDCETNNKIPAHLIWPCSPSVAFMTLRYCKLTIVIKYISLMLTTSLRVVFSFFCPVPPHSSPGSTLIHPHNSCFLLFPQKINYIDRSLLLDVTGFRGTCEDCLNLIEWSCQPLETPSWPRQASVNQ